GTKRIACSECHGGARADASVEGDAASSDFGGAAPTADSCTKCHASEAQRGHRGIATSPTTCLTCHVFGGGKRAAQCADGPARGAEPGAPPLAHHAREGVACGACHAVHGGAVLADCTSCHDQIGAAHGRMAAHATREAGAEGPFDAMMAAAVEPTQALSGEV